MSELLAETPLRRDSITLPTIRVAFVLSVLLHILMLGKWLPQVHVPSADEPEPGKSGGSLVVNLVPPASPPVAPPPSPAVRAAPRPAPQPAPQAPPPAATRPRPAPSPPVMALNKPAPDLPRPPPTVAPAPPAPPAPAGDLSSYIEAQRRARAAPASPSPFSAAAGRPSAPVEDESARGDRAIASNLGLNRAPTFGADATRNGGGIFQIQRLGYTDAEFMFYGWNKDIRRNTTQTIEVRKGDAADIRRAVVRRMIEIIRDHEQEDFLWESPRLGRNVMLSARPKDNAGLEDFMLMEFFRTTQVPR